MAVTGASGFVGSRAVEYLTLADPQTATEQIVRFINGGSPVLVAVSHSRVPGHIILVVGYEGYQEGMCSADFRLVVHDPYVDPATLPVQALGATN